MSDRPDIDPEDSAEAAEYALGLLGASERTAFEARLARSATLRAEVRDWQARFAAMALDEVEAVAPPAALKERVETALFRDARPAGGRVRQWLAGLGAAAAVAVVVLLLIPDAPQSPSGPVYTAEVTGDAGLTLAAAYDAGAGVLTLARQSGGAAPGRALELWLIAGDNPPVSLGVLPGTPEVTLAVAPDLAAALARGLLAVSDEPEGGSPTGQPTGAVLATGPLTLL
jgi:anti-sigma-K factor RskA